MSFLPRHGARAIKTAIGTLAVLGALALTASGARGPAQDAQPFPEVTAPQGQTLAEARFPDAPDGVDSMVTGPVSKEFGARQKSLGCTEVRWPETPVACYPD